MKCCPPTAPLPGLRQLGESGDCSPARGLRQDGEPLYEDHPLLGLMGHDSCCSKDPWLLPLKPRDRRLLSAQDRLSPPALARVGLKGLSARPEEKDRRRLWDGPDGEVALELLRGTKEDDEDVGKEAMSCAGELNEGKGDDDETYLGFLG